MRNAFGVQRSGYIFLVGGCVARSIGRVRPCRSLLMYVCTFWLSVVERSEFHYITKTGLDGLLALALRT